MSGRSRSISFGFGKDTWDAGLTHIFHEARNLNQVYIALTLISKLLSVFAVFLAFDLLRTVSPFAVVFLISFWTSAVLTVLHKPFTSGAQVAFTRKHIVLCALFAIGSGVLAIGWTAGLWLCGPLRFVLIFRHAEYIVLSVVGVFCFHDQAQQSPSRRRGAFLFIAALLVLFFFDSSGSKAASDSNERSGNQAAPQAEAEAAVAAADAGPSARLGMLLLVALAFLELAVNAAGRRLAAVVGGANRLHALSSIVVLVLLIPTGVPALISSQHGWASWLETLSVTLFIALAVSVIDSYVSSLSLAQLGVARTARFAELGTLLSALALAVVWHTQGESEAFRPLASQKKLPADLAQAKAAQPPADGRSGLDSVSLLSSALLLVCALALTGPPSKAGHSGRFIGYSTGGLPLYTVSNEAERRASSGLSYVAAVVQFVRSNMRSIVEDSRTRRILIYLCLNLSFTVVELLYGVWSNSLGLISDSVHMMFDCSALVLALVAATIARWKPTRTHSFGFSRIEVLSGFVNGLFLVLIGASILVAALRRLFDTPRINADRLITVSVLGLCVNLIGMLLLRDLHLHGHGHAHVQVPEARKHKHSSSHDHGHSHDHDHDHEHADDHHSDSHAHHHHHNANLRGVFLHVLADTLGSVGVIVSSLCIQQFGWNWTDPVCSIFISCLILTSSYPLMVDTAEVLVLRTPRSLEYSWTRALAKIERLPGVVVVSRQHFWQHSHGVLCCTLHVRLRADANESFVSQHVSDTVRALGVLHSAVQFEHEIADGPEASGAPLGWIGVPPPGSNTANVSVHYNPNALNMNGSPQRPPSLAPAAGSSALRRTATTTSVETVSQNALVAASTNESLANAPRDSLETVNNSFYVVDHADVKDV